MRHFSVPRFYPETEGPIHLFKDILRQGIYDPGSDNRACGGWCLPVCSSVIITNSRPNSLECIYKNRARAVPIMNRIL